MTVLTGSDITIFQLLVWRRAIKLEKLGMGRRGPSALSIAKKHFNMPICTAHDDVIARIDKELAKYEVHNEKH